MFVTLAEKRYARHASRELLELLRREQREHPERSGRSLYEAVVARRLGPQALRAAEVVRHAEESFTDWPVERELRFRHVAHYLIFHEYTHGAKARQGTRSNIGGAVARVIPEDL
jgi:hypothetical protein